MSDNGTSPHAPTTPRTIAAGREIKPLDKAQFGQKAELAEKLKAILKDVPALHERLKRTVLDLEETTSRARAIVDEWEKIGRTS